MKNSIVRYLAHRLMRREERKRARMENTFVHEQTAHGPIRISCTAWRTHNPINAWLVCGAQKALLLDTGLSVPGLAGYVRSLTGLPLMVVNSHGHFDHTGCNPQFDTVWIHPQDAPLLFQDLFGNALAAPGCEVKVLQGGDSIDLGGTVLDVYEVPGHTPGSIVLHNAADGYLLSGDAIARRIFYTPGRIWTPFSHYFDALERVRALDFTAIYSAHDDMALPKDLIDRLMQALETHLESCENVWAMPGVNDYYLIELNGGPENPAYINISVCKDRRNEAVADIRAWRAAHAQH